MIYFIAICKGQSATPRFRACHILSVLLLWLCMHSSINTFILISVFVCVRMRGIRSHFFQGPPPTPQLVACCVCLFLCLFVCLLACLFLLICLFVCLLVCLFVCLCFILFVLFVCLFACLFVCLLVCFSFVVGVCFFNLRFSA